MPECTDLKRKVIFLVDSSSSIKAKDFKHAKSAVQEIVKTLTIGTNADRVALVVYSYWAELLFNLDTYNNVSDVLRAVKTMRHIEHSTSTGRALTLVKDKIVCNYNLLF